MKIPLTYLIDIILLVIFTVITAVFLYRRKNNLKKEGILYLYRTKLGIKFIDWSAKKFEKFLRPLQYLAILSGYVLMVGMVWLLVKFSWTYLTSPTAAKALKIPVVMPLLPYVPELFKIDFLPPFYFTYWIIIIAMIAVPHEYAHGIFARLHKFKIHSTGFGFLRIWKLPTPFLAAFVEPDEKQMAKAKKLPQMAVLAAGTFANVIVTILFAIIILIYVSVVFVPSGVYVNYGFPVKVNVSEISSFNGYTAEQIKENPKLLGENKMIEVKIDNLTFLTNNGEELLKVIQENEGLVGVMLDTPAYRAQLAGAIMEIDGKKIRSYDELRQVLSEHKPGDIVRIKTAYQESARAEIEKKEYVVKLGERNGKAFLGVGMINIPEGSFLTNLLYKIVFGVKNPIIYYESKIGDFGFFIFDLLWWIAFVSFSVALVNMLPLGIFDGGRFFYLTVWGLTGNEKVGKFAFKVSTLLLLALIIALTLKWIFVFFF